MAEVAGRGGDVTPVRTKGLRADEDDCEGLRELLRAGGETPPLGLRNRLRPHPPAGGMTNAPRTSGPTPPSPVAPRLPGASGRRLFGGKIVATASPRG